MTVSSLHWLQCLHPQADYDWAAAAERAGDAVLAVNSDILVIVEGAGLGWAGLGFGLGKRL